MFRFTPFSAAAIENRIVAAGLSQPSTPQFLSAEGLKQVRLPRFFVHDFSESCIGRGLAAFAAAKRAFRAWTMFDLGWTRVANAAATIQPGQLVVVEVHALGLWALNISRVVDLADDPHRFGFVYATTALHVEEGEERFLLTLDPDSGEVRYTLEAVSRPHSKLAWLGYPVTRAFQHRFARDSHRKMRRALEGEVLAPDSRGV